MNGAIFLCKSHKPETGDGTSPEGSSEAYSPLSHRACPSLLQKGNCQQGQAFLINITFTEIIPFPVICFLNVPVHMLRDVGVVHRANQPRGRREVTCPPGHSGKSRCRSPAQLPRGSTACPCNSTAASAELVRHQLWEEEETQVQVCLQPKHQKSDGNHAHHAASSGAPGRDGRRKGALDGCYFAYHSCLKYECFLPRALCYGKTYRTKMQIRYF